MNSIEKTRAAGETAERAEEKAAGGTTFNLVDYITNSTNSQDGKTGNCKVLTFSPELAAIIGIDEAIIIQQLHYWLMVNKSAGRNLIDGSYWTYITCAELNRQLCYSCEKTIRRALKKLESLGLIRTANYNKIQPDRTKWYTVNYDEVKKILDRNGQNDHFGTGQIVHSNTIDNITIDKNYKATKAQRENRVEHVANYQNYFFRCEQTYGYERFHDMLDFVTEYIEVLYPRYRQKQHPYESRAKRAMFAGKILDCVDYLRTEGADIDDEDLLDALRTAIRCESKLNPFIYLVTSRRVLGYWITELYGYDCVKDTDYDLNSDYGDIDGLYKECLKGA